MYSDPMLNAVAYLIGRARQRTRAALDGHPESGALTLEWIVIAFVIVAAAAGTTLWLGRKIVHWENKVGS
jgi:hypothetical protein